MGYFQHSFPSLPQTALAFKTVWNSKMPCLGLELQKCQYPNVVHTYYYYSTKALFIFSFSWLNYVQLKALGAVRKFTFLSYFWPFLTNQVNIWGNDPKCIKFVKIFQFLLKLNKSRFNMRRAKEKDFFFVGYLKFLALLILKRL